MTKNLYDPEGIYFNQLTEPASLLVQSWGEETEYYSRYSYNGIALSGYFGVGLQVLPETAILAVDVGKVMEISIDEAGLGKYIKIVHWWGESIYALLDTIHVTSGQTITEGSMIATTGQVLPAKKEGKDTSRFHFGIRILPFNRHDGWGGYTDPLPYMAPDAIRKQPLQLGGAQLFERLPLSEEQPYMRRP